MEGVWLSFAVFKKLARTSHKELDFSREESVHADVVGGLEGHGANDRERLASMVGLWVVGARA